MAGETFRGEHHLKVDAKGRAMLPSTFRTVCQAVDAPPPGEGFHLHLVYGGRNRAFVEGFTLAGLADLDRRLGQLPYGEREYSLFEAIYFEQSIPVETDKDGRFSIPQQVRDKLGLGKEDCELTFVGARDSFRIWRADTYQAKRRAEIEALEMAVLGEGPGAADPRSLLKGTV